MTIGRSLPQESPDRMSPFDPEANGDTNRIAPLPFQISANVITTTLVYKQIVQTFVIQNGVNPSGPGGGIGCNPVTNLYCVPRATITKEPVPIATIRCSIV